MSSASLYDSAPQPSLLAQLLAEQQALPAVEKFAGRHLDLEIENGSKIYEERIPIDRLPGAGQQLAFQVDLDACTGCKACVTACHSMNGLATEETWRDVGLIVGRVDNVGFQQTVTTACHHCEDPACLSGCPVQAYEKDAVTGIVRHLDDQCIGCQYCVLKCPYNVPKYSEELKIVRKCDMCTGRLGIGEAPACVQGCPNDAISIEVVELAGQGNTPELISGLNGSLPASSYTRPTTRYVSNRRPTALRLANLGVVEPAPAHDPLAIMLVLLQMSVGTLAVSAIASRFEAMSGFAHSLAIGLAAVVAVLGLCAATLHLGRPLYAFRAFLGWRTSWMSREIIVLGAYVPAVLSAALAATLVSDVLWAFEAAAMVMGALGTVCSMMIYVDTRRRAWALSRTVPLFLGSLLGLGALASAVAVAFGASLEREVSATSAIPLLLVGTLVLVIKFSSEAWLLTRSIDDADVSLARGIQLMRGSLRPRVRFRFALSAAGALAAVATLVLTGIDAIDAVSIFSLGTLLLFLLGELAERHLYFTAEASPGMPDC